MLFQHYNLFSNDLIIQERTPMPANSNPVTESWGSIRKDSIVWRDTDSPHLQLQQETAYLCRQMLELPFRFILQYDCQLSKATLTIKASRGGMPLIMS